MEYKFSEKLSALKPSAIREIFKSLTDPTIISFAAGNPNPLSFPVEALAKISADIFASDAAYALQYGITEGYGSRLPRAFLKNSASDASLTRRSSPPADSRASSWRAKRSAMRETR